MRIQTALMVGQKCITFQWKFLSLLRLWLSGIKSLTNELHGNAFHMSFRHPAAQMLIQRGVCVFVSYVSGFGPMGHDDDDDEATEEDTNASLLPYLLNIFNKYNMNIFK